jgi:hypothetical protein
MKILGDPISAAFSSLSFGRDGKTVCSVTNKDVTLWDTVRRIPISRLALPDPAKENLPTLRTHLKNAERLSKTLEK